MRIQLYYPQWKEKALTFSYDDGQIYDRRLTALFHRYGLRATFHLNSGTLGLDGYVTKEEVGTLYAGHEVACHGRYHEYPTHLSRERLVQEFLQDRLELERLTGEIIRGCSYAFGEYDETVVETLRCLGFSYSRTVEAANGLRVPEDFLRWTPSCHHNEAFSGSLIDTFLHKPDYMRLPLLYIWGHSFEFEREQTWEQMEALCGRLAGHDEIWYTTNQEYADYMQAARDLIFSADGSMVRNLSAVPVYAKTGDRRVKIEPGKTIAVRDGAK